MMEYRIESVARRADLATALPRARRSRDARARVDARAARRVVASFSRRVAARGRDDDATNRRRRRPDARR